MLKGFKEFILRGNVIDLAVAVVIGAAFTGIVTGLVEGILNPVIALELLATGAWAGVGVLGPEAFDARPFLELMARPESEGGYGQPWGQRDS